MRPGSPSIRGVVVVREATGVHEEGLISSRVPRSSSVSSKRQNELLRVQGVPARLDPFWPAMFEPNVSSTEGNDREPRFRYLVTLFLPLGPLVRGSGTRPQRVNVSAGVRLPQGPTTYSSF